MPPPHPTDAEAGPEQVAPTEAVPLAAAAPAPVKKKRNLPGTPGLSLSLSLCARASARRGCFGVGVRATATATATAPSATARSDGSLARPPPPPPPSADPDAEVIALSPGTLLATNRFVCEVCGKGFQRDQNLQLHRRGHNLPWRLRQRGPGAAPPRRRVYVCPEPGCVHHSPTRALGDLTGIKKHFCRKHGEKRWACPRCGKRYAVQADLKAHAKTCGTREYRCDCGTLFTRRDSFVTHRAFCGALGEETGRALAPPAPPSPRPPDLEAEENVDNDRGEENEDSALAEVEVPQRVEVAVPEEPEPEPQRIPSPPPLPQEPPCRPSPPPLPQEQPRPVSPPPLPKEPPCHHPTPPPLPKEPQRLPFPPEQQAVVALVPNVDEPEVAAVGTVAAKLEDETDQDENACFQEADQFKDAELEVSNLLDKDTPMLPCFLPSPSEAIGTDGSSTTCGAGGSVSNSIVPSTTTNTFAGLFASATTSTTSQSRSLRDLIGVDPTFLCLAIGAPSLFPQTSASNSGTFAPPPAPHMSATALLQKATEAGATQSSSSFLKEFGLASSSSSPRPKQQQPHGRVAEISTDPWQYRSSNQQMEMERHQSHQRREMESSSQPWQHPRSTQQMEMERHHQRSHQQREMESSLQPWQHPRSTQQMEMERQHQRNHRQRETESSSQQWHHHHHHPNDQMMGLESYRSNQQRQTESSSQRWPPHRSYQQMEMDPSSQQRWAQHQRSNQQQQQMEMMERHHLSNQQIRSTQQMERRAMVSGGGLGLGLAYESGNPGLPLPDLMTGPSPLLGPKPATLDFLGLGIGGGTMGGSTASRGLPALMVGRELDMGPSAQVPPAAAAAPWEDAKRKTNGRTIL
ncbi:Zinc finger protein MAGPIE [Zea mays]|uniref:Protein EARLY HEADING DATE 2 n=1 Tax=Zea mays TaxID=4577 RepID=A0A3L6E450_MAIZE|nr:Zinc finger protein MAGPIE [Zea mays]